MKKNSVALVVLIFCFVAFSQAFASNVKPNYKQRIVPRDNRHMVIVVPEAGLQVSISATKGDSCGKYRTNSGIIETIFAEETTVMDISDGNNDIYMTFQCKEKEIIVRW